MRIPLWLVFGYIDGIAFVFYSAAIWNTGLLKNTIILPVTLLGDGGYCACPAAGMGGSAEIIEQTALADVLLYFRVTINFSVCDPKQEFKTIYGRVAGTCLKL